MHLVHFIRVIYIYSIPSHRHFTATVGFVFFCLFFFKEICKHLTKLKLKSHTAQLIFCRSWFGVWFSHFLFYFEDYVLMFLYLSFHHTLCSIGYQHQPLCIQASIFPLLFVGVYVFVLSSVLVLSWFLLILVFCTGDTSCQPFCQHFFVMQSTSLDY